MCVLAQEGRLSCIAACRLQLFKRDGLSRQTDWASRQSSMEWNGSIKISNVSADIFCEAQNASGIGDSLRFVTIALPVLAATAPHKKVITSAAHAFQILPALIMLLPSSQTYKALPVISLHVIFRMPIQLLICHP